MIRLSGSNSSSVSLSLSVPEAISAESELDFVFELSAGVDSVDALVGERLRADSVN